MESFKLQNSTNSNITSIPDLSFNYFTLNANGPGSEFDSNGALAIRIELIGSETHQQIGFTDTRVTNQDNY